MRRDSISHEIKTTSNTGDNDVQAPPPSYPSVVYKLEDYSSSAEYDTRPPPPSYSDVNNPAVVYINNYPGPPLVDGIVRIVTPEYITTDQQAAIESCLSKKMRTYFAVNGAITIFFGLVTVGLQIGLLASHSLVYYYYGFWAGALLICIGISTILYNDRHQTHNLQKYFSCFKWQGVFLAVVFGLGVVIMLTDTCDSQTSKNDDRCTSFYKILNAFLLSIIGLTFVQAIINVIYIGILKKRTVIN